MTTAQAVLDRKVVKDTINQMQAYVDTTAEQQWEATYTYYRDQVEDLIQTYAPQLGMASRLGMSAVSGSFLAFHEYKYGRDEYHPKQYSGAVEKNVLCTYHHAAHPLGSLDYAYRYAVERNHREPGTFSDEDLAWLPAVCTPHDLIMGNGRGHDERQSALLSIEVVTKLGLLMLPEGPIVPGITASGWNAQKQRQDFNRKHGYFPVQQAMCIGDLGSLGDQHYLYQAVCIAAEDAGKLMHGRILQRQAAAAGVPLLGATVETCMELFDERPILMDYYKNVFWPKQLSLLTAYPKKAADPKIDSYPGFGGRLQNIDDATALSADLQAGRLSAVGSLLRAREIMHEAF